MNDRRFPSSGEDWSLVHWWRNHPDRGWLWTEIGIGYAGPGNWPNKRSHRRIDVVHFPGHPRQEIREWSKGSEGFAEALHAGSAEIVEAKNELNYAVIGQCIAGVDMLSRAYPDHQRLDQIALVRGTPDPALQWACNALSIEVVAYEEQLIQDLKRSEVSQRP